MVMPIIWPGPSPTAPTPADDAALLAANVAVAHARAVSGLRALGYTEPDEGKLLNDHAAIVRAKVAGKMRLMQAGKVQAGKVSGASVAAGVGVAAGVVGVG